MKVLFFIENLVRGGKERRLTELIYALTINKDVECELVVANPEIYYERIKDLNIKVHILERKTKKDLSLFFSFYKIAKKFNPDIIHVWGNMVAAYAVPTKLLLGIPMINNQIADAPIKVKKNAVLFFNLFFSDKIISNSKAGLKIYGVSDKKGMVIYNGFDFERIKHLENTALVKQKFNIKPGLIVGMVATFSKHKDYLTYIKVAIKILETRSDVTFLCIGAGNYQPFYNMIPPEYRDNILFLGKQKNVESIMNSCDIGVLTSFGEGISNALLEFMALGKPVIATDLGGNPELVENESNGFLIEQSNEAQLIKHLHFLFDNDDFRFKLGDNNKNKIIEKFGITKMKNSFFDVYKSFVNNQN